MLLINLWEKLKLLLGGKASKQAQLSLQRGINFYEQKELTPNTTLIGQYLTYVHITALESGINS